MLVGESYVLELSCVYFVKHLKFVIFLTYLHTYICIQCFPCEFGVLTLLVLLFRSLIH